jgi:hypothetical protein
MADSNLVLFEWNNGRTVRVSCSHTSSQVIQYRKKRYMAFYLDFVVEAARSLFFIRWPMHASLLILALFLS